MRRTTAKMRAWLPRAAGGACAPRPGLTGHLAPTAPPQLGGRGAELRRTEGEERGVRAWPGRWGRPKVSSGRRRARARPGAERSGLDSGRSEAHDVPVAVRSDHVAVNRDSPDAEHPWTVELLLQGALQMLVLGHQPHRHRVEWIDVLDVAGEERIEGDLLDRLRLGDPFERAELREPQLAVDPCRPEVVGERVVGLAHVEEPRRRALQPATHAL